MTPEQINKRLAEELGDDGYNRKQVPRKHRQVATTGKASAAVGEQFDYIKTPKLFTECLTAQIPLFEKLGVEPRFTRWKSGRWSCSLLRSLTNNHLVIGDTMSAETMPMASALALYEYLEGR